MEPNATDSRALAILGVPSSAGARRVGQEGAPSALRAAGLVRSLRDRGIDVVDQGDLPPVTFRPDADHPTAQNLGLVERVAREVSLDVERIRGEDALPVVLGGDCTITLGVVAGLLAEGSSLGLLYFDGDLDLNTPGTSPSGILDGMVTAHLLGRGDRRLAGLGPRCPLLEEADLVYFGYDVGAGGIDRPELSSLGQMATPRFPLEAIRDDPKAAARQALATLEGRVERILVHFDVDVTDTAAVDVPHSGGLSLEDAVEVLELFLASPRCAGLVVTELNPELDADGSVTRRLAGCLAGALTTSRGARSGDPRSRTRRRSLGEATSAVATTKA
jgi:arginase